MMDIFVNANERINVDVYVWEVKDESGNVIVNATEESNNIPNEYKNESKIIKFVFKRPNFNQSNTILRPVASNTSAALDMQELILSTLLVEIVNDGERVESRPNVISKLVPVIARAAANGLLDKIQLA